MNVEEFVTETLKQIINGVLAAQEYGLDKGVRINPTSIETYDSDGKFSSSLPAPNEPRNVQFDIAVTTTTATSKQAGAGLSVWGIGIGGQGEKGSSDQVVSRISFTIPVQIPQAYNPSNA